MKWLFKVDSSDSLFEKIVENAVPVLVIIGYLYMVGSGVGVFKNCYQQSCSHAGFIWNAIGFLLSCYAPYFYWRGATDRSKLNVGQLGTALITFALITLAWQSFTGFNWWFNVCQ